MKIFYWWKFTKVIWSKCVGSVKYGCCWLLPLLSVDCWGENGPWSLPGLGNKWGEFCGE